MTKALTTAAMAAAVALVPASAADAATRVPKAIWGPTENAGMSLFPIYEQLRVGTYQYPLQWSNVAPTKPANPRDPDDPAYRWPADLDAANAETARYGMKLLLRVARTPGWANGGREDNVPPTNPRDYADFLEAASERYPRVRRWMIWEEPIRLTNWETSPQTATGRPNVRPLTSVQRRDVRTYATLLDVSYGRLKKLSRGNLVIGGNTTTSGDVMGPFNFIRNLKLPSGRAPRMDLFGHNPFGARRPDLDRDPAAPGTADLSDMDTLNGWLDRYLGDAPNGRPLRVFVSEYTIPTDGPGFQFPFFTTRAIQSSWLRSALNIARRPSSRIATLGWYSIIDLQATADREGSNVGLIDLVGRRKPAFATFATG